MHTYHHNCCLLAEMPLSFQQVSLPQHFWWQCFHISSGPVECVYPHNNVGKGNVLTGAFLFYFLSAGWSTRLCVLLAAIYIDFTAAHKAWSFWYSLDWMTISYSLSIHHTVSMGLLLQWRDFMCLFPRCYKSSSAYSLMVHTHTITPPHNIVLCLLHSHAHNWWTLRRDGSSSKHSMSW